MNQLFYMVLYAYVPISYFNCDLILFMFPYINSKMYKKNPSNWNNGQVEKITDFLWNEKKRRKK